MTELLDSLIKARTELDKAVALEQARIDATAPVVVAPVVVPPVVVPPVVAPPVVVTPVPETAIKPVVWGDFTKSAIPSGWKFYRNSTATDLTYQSKVTNYNTFNIDTPRFFGQDGIFIEEDRTAYFLNNEKPVSQTIVLTKYPWESFQYFCVWIIGPGSVTVSQGSATVTGLGEAKQGKPLIFKLTKDGTVNVTVTGTVWLVQLENGPGPTSFIPVKNGPVTRGADICQTNVQGLWNYNEGTFAMEFIYYSGGKFQDNNHLDGVDADNGGTSFAFFHSWDITTPGRLVADGATAGSDLYYSHGMTFNEWHKIVGAWSSRTGQQMTFDGLPVESAGVGGATNPKFVEQTVVLFMQNHGKEGGSGLVRNYRLWDKHVGDLLSLSTK